MEIVEKYVVDLVEIVQSTGIIQVRCIKQKWVKSGDQELLVEPRVGFHRFSLAPGQWSEAESLGVKSYADAAWSPDVIAAYNSAVQKSEEQLSLKLGI